MKFIIVLCLTLISEPGLHFYCIDHNKAVLSRENENNVRQYIAVVADLQIRDLELGFDEEKKEAEERRFPSKDDVCRKRLWIQDPKS